MSDIRELGTVKAGEVYVFRFRDDQQDEICGGMARWAGDPRLAFSWYDAAVGG